MQVGTKVQVGKILKINKSAGWNKAVQVEILGKFITINYGFCFKILFNKSVGWIVKN